MKTTRVTLCHRCDGYKYYFDPKGRNPSDPLAVKEYAAEVRAAYGNLRSTSIASVPAGIVFHREGSHHFKEDGSVTPTFYNTRTGVPL